MFTKAIVKPNTYSDSMILMALSTKVNELPIVKKAMVGMGTNLNKQVALETGLSGPEIEKATPRDQMIIVQCETEALCDEALELVEVLRAEGLNNTATEASYASSNAAFAAAEDSSLVIISVPGEYAAKEAKKALIADKNVMLFSDNVSIEDEYELKQYAHEHELLVMGPDCGTAIINGVGLCFANSVNEGVVGMVAASGTGSQEVSVQVDAMGAGISQLIGVGGRDLSEEIGGIMMLDGMEMLNADPNTQVIILLSKPPSNIVSEKILAEAGKLNKPVVVCFIGAEKPDTLAPNIRFVDNTFSAAAQAVALATGKAEQTAKEYEFDYTKIRENLDASQTYVRGLFCGGTVCDEVFHAISRVHEETYSNHAKDPAKQLQKGKAPRGNCLIDLGADEYTQGRPHPMIDPTIRNQEIIDAADDENVAVLLLDFELGYGSHHDPVGAALEAIVEAKEKSIKNGRDLVIVAYVLGTEKDRQNKAQQISKLTNVGVVVVDAAVDLAKVALNIIKK